MGAQPASDAAAHKAHHPAAASGPSAKSKKCPGVDQQRKQMQAMHEKMMAATTLQERAALMDEQMKSMQNDMQMMDLMKQDSSGMPMSGQKYALMEMRLDMMPMMMQAMMDRQSAQNPRTGK
ncbi:hypothetical protein [Paraburkholderia bengalensis]